MQLQVLDTDIHILNMQTRMPFRYGIATMTALPHLFLRLRLDLDDRVQQGVAADHLPPKWFTKNVDTSFQADIDEMLDVIQSAAALAQEAGAASSVFDLWQRIYQAQQAWAAGSGYPPLLWAFGVSLVERALIDAFCRANEISFALAVRTNRLGIRLEDIHPELEGAAPADLLLAQPLSQISARHTVGLSDPLRDAEIPPSERVDDGLPQSLEAAISAYGLTHFKIKIGGDGEADLARLRQIAALLEERLAARGRTYAFTLDGNEQYRSVASFRTFWRALTAEPVLAAFRRRLLFVEQPLSRDIALSPEAGQALHAWRDRPPIIIDESDGRLDSVRVALERGYSGTSHKNCKGVFKGIANTCLIRQRQAAQPERSYLMSGEDLSNVGPVALLQDLAVLATLGIEHAERNGHHYFAGLSMLPADLQESMLAQHGDLYHRHCYAVDGDDAETCFAAVDIQNGRVQVASVVEAPFGLKFALDSARFTALADWRFDSLQTNDGGSIEPLQTKDS